MKKLGVMLGLLMLCGTAHAVERGSKASQSMVIDTGSSISFVKSIIYSTGTIQISTGTSTRGHVTCRNLSSFTILIGTGALSNSVLSPGYGTFLVGEATSTIHTFDTYNTASLYAIGLVGSGAVGSVQCAEER